ncbi:MAG: hypothetical protein FWD61_03020 [Phycisphaerales bacterium]|nr:hypothetical protein [Phycisphaerales bacterium]
MAVVHARSTPPYATIIFVFLWVIATGVAIWLAVQRGDDAKKLAAADAKVAAASKDVKDAGVVVDRLKNTMLAEPGKSADDVIAESTKVLQETGQSTLSLVSAVRDMATRAKKSDEIAAQLKDQNADLERQVGVAIKDKDAAVTAGTASLNQEKAAAAAARDESAKIRADYETQLTDAQAKHTKDSEEREATHRRDVLQIDQLTQDVAKLNSIIQQKNEQIALMRHKGDMTLAGIEAAGTIIRARPGSNECYINLGRKDRVVPGLTFSVHDPRIGVKLPIETDMSKPNADTEGGGKASIEVMQVGESESLCRITFTRRGQHIDQGDLIANLFYQQNKNKKFHFVIFGDFDLDGDGIPTTAERDRLVRLITSWGGVVDETITPDTDYLVLGTRPAAPATKAVADKAAPEAGGVVDQQSLNQKIYDDLFVEAKRASVPILNANRFLTFIGYYNNTVATK